MALRINTGHPQADLDKEPLRAPSMGGKQNLPPRRPQTTRNSEDRLDLFKQELKEVVEQTDIVDLIEPFIDGGLKQSSGGDMIGLCPFHGDTNPSFGVNGAKGVYMCRACSAGLNESQGGDALTFVRRRFGMGVRDAFEYLAQRINYPSRFFNNDRKFEQPPIPAQPVIRKAEPEKPVAKSSMEEQYKTLSIASAAYQQVLNTSSEASDYLFSKRGIKEDLKRRFVIGYAPDGFNFLKPFFNEYEGNDALIDTGLIKNSTRNPTRFFDTFRERVLFAVRDDEGQVVGFGGRLIEDKSFIDKQSGKEVFLPKYLNSPDTPLFNKSELLFGFYEAKYAMENTQQAIVVEGYMDVIGLANHGVFNSVACMGVALSEFHAKKLSSRAKQIVICMDGDKAGQDGALRSLNGVLPQMKEGLDIRFLTLPDEMDPDEFLNKHGKAAFEEQVNSSPSLPIFLQKAINQVKERTEEETARKRQEMVSRWLRITNKEASSLVSIIKALDTQVGLTQKTKQEAASTGAFKRTRKDRSSDSFVNQRQLSPMQRLSAAMVLAPQAAKKNRSEIADLVTYSPVEHQPFYKEWLGNYDRLLATLTSTEQVDDCPDASVIVNGASKVAFSEVMRKIEKAGDQERKSQERYSAPTF